MKLHRFDQSDENKPKSETEDSGNGQRQQPLCIDLLAKLNDPLGPIWTPGQSLELKQQIEY